MKVPRHNDSWTRSITADYRPVLIVAKTITALFALFFFISHTVAAETLVSPHEWLAKQLAPVFRKGYTLPRLTRYGWSLSVPLRIELTERWGYALSVEEYLTQELVESALTKPNSPNGQIIALARSDPDRYPLSVILSRDMPKTAPAQAWLHDAGGNRLDRPPYWSPAAPGTALDLLAEERAVPLRRLVEQMKPAIVLNGGEYGIGVIGHLLTRWQNDPAVVAGRGNRDWFEYISSMKAREQIRIRDAVKAAVKAPFLYVYYTNGGGPHRGRDANWRSWEYDYAAMVDVATYPSNAFYYKQFNNGWLRGGGKGDLLTQALNAKGREIASGRPFSYDWVSGGWHENTAGAGESAGGTALVDVTTAQQSPIALYRGFLTCLYVAGTLGVNAGYYAYPTGGFDRRFAPDSPPNWLLQLAATAHVHAIASHIEPFVRNSRLVEGPDRHTWGEFPAYELPSGKPNVRVLARVHNRSQAALVAVWSAAGGHETAKITLEKLGTFELAGDDAANLYIVRPGVEPLLLTPQVMMNLPTILPELFAAIDAKF